MRFPPRRLPATRDFTVAGYFKTGIYELDSKGILMSLEAADEFLSLTSAPGVRVVSGVRIAARPELRGENELKGLRATVE